MSVRPSTPKFQAPSSKLPAAPALAVALCFAQTLTRLAAKLEAFYASRTPLRNAQALSATADQGCPTVHS